MFINAHFEACGIGGDWKVNITDKDKQGVREAMKGKTKEDLLVELEEMLSTLPPENEFIDDVDLVANGAYNDYFSVEQ